MSHACADHSHCEDGHVHSDAHAYDPASHEPGYHGESEPHEHDHDADLEFPESAHHKNGEPAEPGHHHHHDECEISPRHLVRSTRAFATENTQRSWWELLSTFALFAGICVGTLAPLVWPLRLFCAIISGLLMVRLFVIYHDHQHRSILSKSRVAKHLMRVFGILALTPNKVWTTSHNYHHTYNSKLRASHIGSFPIMTSERYASTTRGERLKYCFMRHPLTIFAGYITVFLLGMSFLPFINSPKENYDGLLALIAHAGIATVLWLLGGWQTALFAFFIPYAIAGGLGSYLFYAQHNFPSVKHYNASGWTYEGAALESSSFMRLPKIMHWFTANIGYHHIHHLNARIPFYRLPEAMRAIPGLQAPKTTSLRPTEILRCLRLKVWDEKHDRMAPSPRLKASL